MFYPPHILLSRYRYDPLDRLISHARSTVPNHRFYCKSRLVTELQEALRHSIVQHGDLLLAQHRHENDALATTTLLATDLQRSVLHTLEKNAGRQAIAYAPYGHRSAESGLTSLLGFNGERPDPVTGHYLLGNGYRAFNPVLMRFNSPDSLSPFGEGGLNSYAYCEGDPVNFGDSSGHSLSAFLGLFSKISQMPDVLKEIIQRLPAKDMVSLAQTSKSMKGVVYSSAKKLPVELDGAVRINLAWGEGSTRGVNFRFAAAAKHTSLRIGSAMVEGNLPVQIPNAGIKLIVPSDAITEHVPELVNDLRFTGPSKNWTLTQSLGDNFNIPPRQQWDK